MKTNKVFFAFGKVQESKEASDIKRYVGYAPCKILSVNPTAKELSEIYGRDIDKEPEYLSTVDKDGKQINVIRLDFYLKTIASKCNDIDIITKMTFFVRNSSMISSAGKLKVIDKYGRTAWVTKEEFENKAIPQYSNGPARLDKAYRPIYQGEEELLNMIKKHINIDNVDEYVNGAWRMKDNPEDYEAGFSNILSWFKGDVSEIKDVLKLVPNNESVFQFGVRTTDDGKEYQDVFTRFTMKLSAKNRAEKFKEAVEDAQNNGAYPNTVFEFCELKEYSPKPTSFNNESTDDLPFGPSENPWA